MREMGKEVGGGGGGGEGARGPAEDGESSARAARFRYISGTYARRPAVSREVFDGVRRGGEGGFAGATLQVGGQE